MKPEQQAWRDLQAHAAAQIRPGFAERVLRAARNLPGMPSFLDQFAYSIGTAALCAVVALYVHSRSLELESERNLASWHQIALHVEDADPGL